MFKNCCCRVILGGGRGVGGGSAVGVGMSTGKEVKAVKQWLEERLRAGDVPRLGDVFEWSKREGLGLKRKDVRAVLEGSETYMFNLPQQRARTSSRRWRPVLSTNLGYLHGDIGFFSKSRHYETPKTYQAGFLICKDTLSRYTYLVLLRKNRQGDEMVRAFETLLALHRAAGHTHPIRGISFDQERSVVSKKVQSFFKSNGIKFTAFKMSRSKAKFAEGGIRLVRETMARLERQLQSKGGGTPKKRWWNLLSRVADILNGREIVVEGRRLGFSPVDVREDNLDQFFEKLYKASPALAAAQFRIDSRFVTFKYAVGTYVRAKLVVTSSAVIGEKRSETNVTEEVFRIQEAFPHVNKRMGIGKSYRCVDIRTGGEEIFDEDDLVPTDPEAVTWERHAAL